MRWSVVLWGALALGVLWFAVSGSDVGSAAARAARETWSGRTSSDAYYNLQTSPVDTWSSGGRPYDDGGYDLLRERAYNAERRRQWSLFEFDRLWGGVFEDPCNPDTYSPQCRMHR